MGVDDRPERRIMADPSVDELDLPVIVYILTFDSQQMRHEIRGISGTFLLFLSC